MYREDLEKRLKSLKLILRVNGVSRNVGLSDEQIESILSKNEVLLEASYEHLEEHEDA